MRNVHQAFGYGLFAGLAFAGLSIAHAAAGWPDDLHGHPGHERMKTLARYYGSRQSAASDAPSNATTIDRKLTFDKVTNVHYSGTSHDEDQPVASARAHRGLQLDLRARVRAPVHALLSGERLRDRARRRRHAAAADQRVELRALQDVRHHGSLPGDHLGAAGRRRRASIQWHVESDCQSKSKSNLRLGSELGIGIWDCA